MRIAFGPVLACALCATGCYKATVVNDTVPPGGTEDSKTLVYFLWGLVGDPEVDTREMCHGDVRELTYEAGPLGVIVGALTLGIVSLREVDVTCAGTPRAATREPAREEARP
jgi:hypothetical protein